MLLCSQPILAQQEELTVKQRTMKFDYARNCTVVHFILQGEQEGGRPVMVIPRNPLSVVAGRTYEVELDYSYKQVTFEPPVYVLNGVEYRVVHAGILREVEGTEGDDIDVQLYKPRETPTNKLGDLLPSHVRERLEAIARAA